MDLLTPDQLKERLRALSTVGRVTVKAGMRSAGANVTRRAKLNCTPGESPYDPMVFPTKMIDFTAKKSVVKRQLQFSPNKVNRSGAPFDIGDLRRSINFKVNDDGVNIWCVVGTKLYYSGFVHDGTSKMQARPFIFDAVEKEHEKTMEYLSMAVDATLMQVSQGNVWFNPTQIGIVPTMPDGEGGEE